MITQLLISSSGKPIITASYVIVGGGGGAVLNGANGLGGTVINGDTIILDGSYSIIIGAGGTAGGGVGSSSSFMSLVATGSTRTSTVSIDGETFSGIDYGSPNSSIKGSGAQSSTYRYPPGFCRTSEPNPARCQLRGDWTYEVSSGGIGNNGVVILKIPTSYASRISASGADVTTSGSNTIYRFNSSGSLVAS